MSTKDRKCKIRISKCSSAIEEGTTIRNLKVTNNNYEMRVSELRYAIYNLQFAMEKTIGLGNAI